MLSEIFMPKNGMDMTEGTIVRWLKNVGDPVEKDEPVMEIETDKIVMEAESPGSGILLKKLYEDGETVPVLTVIGYVGDKDDPIPESTAASVQSQEKSESKAETAQQYTGTAVQFCTDKIPATPHAKAIAKEKEISLSIVQPSGKDGQITAADVMQAAASTPLARKKAQAEGVKLNGITGTGFGGKITGADVGTADPVAQVLQEIEGLVERRKLTSMRKVIARRMLESRTNIPDVTVEVQADVTELMQVRKAFNEGHSSRVSVNDFIIRAVAIATREHERVRMQFDGNEYLLFDPVNVGMAVGTDDGLLVPVIRNADKLDLLAISAESKRLANDARSGKLSRADLGDARITISNLGMFGVHSFTSIINEPESAIIGAASAEDVLALDAEGRVVVRKKMMLSVNFDHRILNGTEAVQFINRVKQLLETPAELTQE